MTRIIYQREHVRPYPRTISRLLHRFPRLVLVTRQVRLIYHGGPNMPIFQGVRRYHCVVILKQSARARFFYRPIRIVRVKPRIRLYPTRPAIRCASVHGLIKNRIRRQPTRLYIYASRVHFKRLFSTIIHRPNRPFNERIGVVCPRDFKCFNRIRRTVNRVLRVTIPYLRALKNIKGRRRTLFHGRHVCPVSHPKDFHYHHFPPIQFPSGTIPGVVRS